MVFSRRKEANMIRTALAEYKQRLRCYWFRRRMQISSLEETIEKIKNDNCSISRFGDGEFYIMEGSGIGFQSESPLLSERLREIIHSSLNNHLICISSGFNPKNYPEFTKKHIKWMKKHFRNTTEMRFKYIDANRLYYNLLISRFWIPFRDKERAKRVANQLREVWQNRNVVIIEGEKTRMGVGNDLLDEVKTCRRILCPATNAFDKYDEILSAALNYPKDTLFLIALGPTATVLAYDLCKSGFQALDIGHVDLEYEWMKMGADKKVDLSNKYVNEVSGGSVVSDIQDEKFFAEIDYRIS